MTDWVSVWMDETSPEEFRAECPHVSCSREDTHDGHGWRGTSREFGGAVEVTRTYWCAGKPADAPTEESDG
jgi:hypothetical protein